MKSINTIYALGLLVCITTTAYGSEPKFTQLASPVITHTELSFLLGRDITPASTSLEENLGFIIELGQNIPSSTNQKSVTEDIEISKQKAQAIQGFALNFMRDYAAFSDLQNFSHLAINSDNTKHVTAWAQFVKTQSSADFMACFKHCIDAYVPAASQTIDKEKAKESVLDAFSVAPKLSPSKIDLHAPKEPSSMNRLFSRIRHNE